MSHSASSCAFVLPCPVRGKDNIINIHHLKPKLNRATRLTINDTMLRQLGDGVP
jgi:hypothetical protein